MQRFTRLFLSVPMKIHEGACFVSLYNDGMDAVNYVASLLKLPCRSMIGQQRDRV